MSFRMALGSSPVREIMIGVITQSFFIICSLMFMPIASAIG